jgi:hypothetical protein
VFAQPVARYQGHLLRIGLVQRRIIDDQHPSLPRHEPFDFLPQDPPIRLASLQQARVGIMRWTVFSIGMSADCFCGCVGLL